MWQAWLNRRSPGTVAFIDRACLNAWSCRAAHNLQHSIAKNTARLQSQDKKLAQFLISFASSLSCPGSLVVYVATEYCMLACLCAACSYVIALSVLLYESITQPGNLLLAPTMSHGVSASHVM